jgi:methionyl-tRNA synthetase
MKSKEKIDFDTFLEASNKLEIKIGMIRSVERVPKSNKMLKLEVSFGDNDRRTVATNIGDRIEDIEELVTVQLPFITNLEPVKIMSVMSEAMIMVAENEDGEIEFEQFTNGSTLLG